MHGERHQFSLCSLSKWTLKNFYRIKKPDTDLCEEHEVSLLYIASENRLDRLCKF